MVFNKKCFVSGCSFTSSLENDEPNSSFFRIPKDLEKQWLTMIGRKDNKVTNQVVCSKHFRKGDILQVGNRLQLRKGAIPVLNIPKYTITIKRTKIPQYPPITCIAPHQTTTTRTLHTKSENSNDGLSVFNTNSSQSIEERIPTLEKVEVLESDETNDPLDFNGLLSGLLHFDNDNVNFLPDEEDELVHTVKEPGHVQLIQAFHSYSKNPIKVEEEAKRAHEMLLKYRTKYKNISAVCKKQKKRMEVLKEKLKLLNKKNCNCNADYSKDYVGPYNKNGICNSSDDDE